MQRKLLALCDSPTVPSGFGRVARNLFREWRGFFNGGIDVWGINYHGWPHSLPYTIYPAQSKHWADIQGLQQFLERLARGHYTHVWMMQDTFHLAGHNFPEVLKKQCDAQGTRSFGYFPVDAKLCPEWTEIAHCVDVAVAYTEYGRREFDRWSRKSWLEVLPHGVDASIYRPLPRQPHGASPGREALRSRIGAGSGKSLGLAVGPDDFLMVNVNKNQRRKGLAQSLQVLAELKKEEGGRRNLEGRIKNEEPAFAEATARQGGYRLLMHMTGQDLETLTDLEVIGRDLGLVQGRDWNHTGTWDGAWVSNHGMITEEGLNELYNAADAVLTTSLGEGWGFSITEGLAAGTPVFCPAHTSCADIARHVEALGMPGRVMLLPVGSTGIVLDRDNNRMRYPVDVEGAARTIADHRELVMAGRKEGTGVAMNKAVREWLDWKRIASEWVRLFRRR